MRFLAAVSVCGLAACNSILGVGEVHPGSGAPDAAVDAPPTTPDAGPSDVHGTAIDTFVSGVTTTETAPEDLSSLTLAAYVPDGKGGFQVIAGHGAKDGTFTIPQVPAGAYYLLTIDPTFPQPSFYYTTSRTPELGYERLGRVSGPQVTKSTPLDFQMTGATATTTGDQFEIVSYADGGSSFPADFSLPPGTTAMDVPSDWMQMSVSGKSPLLQSGDDVWVLHFVRASDSQQGNPETVFTLVDTYSSFTIGLTDGVPKTVSAAFTPVTRDKAQSVQIMETQFLQGLDVTPDQPLAFGIRRRTALGLESALSIRGVLQVNATISKPQQFVSFFWPYGDPYPSTWGHYIFHYEEPGWTYVTRGSNLKTAFYSAWTFGRETAADFLNIAPAMPAPHNIKVGGVLAGAAAAVPFDGAHAVDVTWTPVLGITHYTVTAMLLDAPGNQPQLTTVASFDTNQSSVTMPASLFVVGSTYVIAVAARTQGNVDYAGGTLRRSGFPQHAREGVTARLLFASSCGDGAMNAAYEECDSSGAATATCNADCSKTKCGDGVANGPAGEACDTGGDSVICDADCTAVTCGDGHVNATAGEACDLGAMNGMAGKCCSATCTLVPPATACP